MATLILSTLIRRNSTLDMNAKTCFEPPVTWSDLRVRTTYQMRSFTEKNSSGLEAHCSTSVMSLLR